MLACRKRQNMVWVVWCVWFFVFLWYLLARKQKYLKVFWIVWFCIVNVPNSCAQNLPPATSFSVLCWTHLGFVLLRRYHWVFYLLVFMPVISSLSAVGRHWTPHFGMQCLDPIKWHWKEMFKQYRKENGAWGLGLKLVSNSSEFYLDWWASANSLVDLLVGLLLH